MDFDPAFGFDLLPARRTQSYPTDPVQDLVVRASKRQEPRLAVVEAQRRAGKENASERNFVTAAADLLRNFRSQVRRHRHPVTRISKRIVNPVALPSVRHGIETE